jgi:hypothetical protein
LSDRHHETFARQQKLDLLGGHLSDREVGYTFGAPAEAEGGVVMKPIFMVVGTIKVPKKSDGQPGG